MKDLLLFRGAEVEHLGYLPAILLDSDPRPVREQLDDRYSHGGGFQPFDGFTLDESTYALLYPGDEPLRALARWKTGNETCWLYERGWLRIVQPDGRHVIVRVD